MLDERIIDEIIQSTDISIGIFTKQDAESLKKALEGAATVAIGGFKATIILDNDDHVYKLPYTGEYDEEGYYWDFDYIGDAIPIYPKINNNDWDSCLLEQQIYEKAEEYSVNVFFVPIKKETNILDNFPLYSQEKCNEFYENQISEEYKNKIRESLEKYPSELLAFNFDWIVRAAYLYGEDKILNFANFLRDFRICDIHSDNIGYDNEGYPVIFDYSL